MTSILTQKRRIITFVESNKDNFYRRLKNIKLRAIRNPENETAHTAKHKRVLPILTSVGREHETLNFLAVIFLKLTLHIQRREETVYLYEKAKASSRSTSYSYVISAFNN